MLTSWDAPLGVMERVVGGAGNKDVETDIGHLRGLIDRKIEDD